MNWLNPTYLWALLFVPAVVGLLLWATLQRRKATALFGDASLVKRLSQAISTRKRRWKGALFAVGILFLSIALAGPRFGTKLKEVNREGVDLIIALDVSASMLAEDVAPNRLARAKFEIIKLLDELTGDRVGLVVFAGDAFVQCPLTLDYSAIRLFLDITDETMVPTPGTDFERAMQVALQAFESGTKEETNEKRSRALLFISDGENHIGNISSIKSTAKDAGITVFTTGVGELQGAPIPETDRNGNRKYKTDKNGQTVTTKLEEDGLKELGADGAYFRIARTSSSLSEFNNTLARLERSDFGSEMFEEYDEKYQWPLVIAFLLFVGEWFISERSRKISLKPPFLNKTS